MSADDDEDEYAGGSLYLQSSAVPTLTVHVSCIAYPVI